MTLNEAGKAAANFMDAMKSQPIMLGLVIVDLAMVGMLYFVLSLANKSRATEFELIFKQQSEVSRLLSQCIVPGKPDGG